MVDVITGAEVLEDQSLDSLGGPQLRGVPRVLGPTRQELDERPALADGQFWRTTRPRLAPKGGIPFLLRRLQPLADRGTAYAELSCDIGLGDSLPIQRDGLKSTVFEGDRVSSFSHAARLQRLPRFVK